MSKGYQLPDEQLLACARLCYQEQGTAKGAAAEMSLALNLYEKNSAKYASVYDYMRNSGWFANAAYFMDYGRCTGAVLEAVSDVLAGNRTLPEYVDEHDCFSDIVSISTGSKTNRSDYIPNKTIITNAYGAVYTFYCFPDEWADPFGYTGKPVAKVDPVQAAIDWMTDLAEDDSHGYDQIYRWGEKGDYDCSSAVITAYKQAGIPLTCTYTGDMYEDMTTKGFADVTDKIDLSSGVGLLPGDVLLNHIHHTALYIGDGLEAEASINEKGTATGGKPGDQTGREILIRPYRNYPWDCVLRYVGDVDKEPVKTKSTRVDVPYLQKGCIGADVSVLQFELNLIGNYGLDVDGEFGPDTDRALRGYQDSKGIKVSGIRGITTYREIREDIAAKTYKN